MWLSKYLHIVRKSALFPYLLSGYQSNCYTFEEFAKFCVFPLIKWIFRKSVAFVKLLIIADFTISEGSRQKCTMCREMHLKLKFALRKLSYQKLSSFDNLICLNVCHWEHHKSDAQELGCSESQTTKTISDFSPPLLLKILKLNCRDNILFSAAKPLAKLNQSGGLNSCANRKRIAVTI